jgi:glycosyltransferase involved in cell wall biosynthesis
MSINKVSIITVAKNSEKYIEETIRSVISQTYKNKEFIVVDGGSEDRTIDIIKRYESDINYFISEPDNGIAEAMNKGIELATGDYVLFLNSDDYLMNDSVLEKVSSFISEELDIYIFKVLFLYEDGRTITSLIHGLGLLTNFKMGSCHQGQFISRRLLLKLGKFDTKLKINFDYDFILRAYKAGASFKACNEIVSVMRQVGISSRRDWIGFKSRYDEEKIVHYKNCSNNGMRYIYKIYWLLYIPYRYLRYILILINKKYIKNKSIKSLQ